MDKPYIRRGLRHILGRVKKVLSFRGSNVVYRHRGYTGDKIKEAFSD